MKKSLSFASLLLLVLFATTSFAADATGTWKGSSKEGPWAFRLKSEAGTVTGNTYSAEGKELPIKNGKLEGDNITFSFDSEWQGQPITLVAKGTMKADTMTLHVQLDSGYWETDVNLSRSAK
jgi:hypothetical protein